MRALNDRPLLDDFLVKTLSPRRIMGKIKGGGQVGVGGTEAYACMELLAIKL
jgi:hypothetical protein